VSWSKSPQCRRYSGRGRRDAPVRERAAACASWRPWGRWWEIDISFAAHGQRVGRHRICCRVTLCDSAARATASPACKTANPLSQSDPLGGVWRRLMLARSFEKTAIHHSTPNSRDFNGGRKVRPALLAAGPSTLIGSAVKEKGCCKAAGAVA
jgi:hypothetical protein